jgi:hypothetical protein
MGQHIARKRVYCAKEASLPLVRQRRNRRLHLAAGLRSGSIIQRRKLNGGRQQEEKEAKRRTTSLVRIGKQADGSDEEIRVVLLQASSKRKLVARSDGLICQVEERESGSEDRSGEREG